MILLRRDQIDLAGLLCTGSPEESLLLTCELSVSCVLRSYPGSHDICICIFLNTPELHASRSRGRQFK
jgi:hypothetical protein